MSAVARLAPVDRTPRYRGPEWTPRRLSVVRAMHADGKSAAEIATEIGVTRSAVLGAMRRDREHATGERQVTPARQRSAPIPLPAEPCPSLPLFESAWGVPESRRVPFLDATSRQCRYIDDDSADEPTCCGAPTVKNGSYCAGHHAIVYRGSAK
jgi:hypothetical protein